MERQRHLAAEPLDAGDVELFRYMRRSFNCRQSGVECPALADCPEGFYVCDAIANILTPGTRPELGYTAKTAVRFLYDQIECEGGDCCPARGRCHEGEREPCATLMLKLGVLAG